MSAAAGAPHAAGYASPSPLEFALEAMEAEGALLERLGDKAVAILPPGPSERLGMPEECHLAVYPERKEEIGCGLGSPLLERLIAEARGRPVIASVALDLNPPRSGHARAAAERFVLRNGLCEIEQVSMGAAIYVAAFIAYVVESDDRREGLARLLLCAEDGAEPDDALRALLDLTWPSALIRRAPAPLSTATAADFLGPRAELAVRAAASPKVDEVRRRHARDHERIATYFADLIAEARAPRRRADPKTVEAKVAHLTADRDAKLAALPARFAVRVTCSPAALVCAELPVARVNARLRRRKEARDIVLRLPAGATTLDRLTCEACGAATAKPAACDERMHLLCEACAPNAQGRIACPACRK